MSVRKRFRKNIKGKENKRSVEVWLQDTQPEIVELVAATIGKRRDSHAVDDAIDHYFWAIRFAMENDSFPEIDLGPLGRFSISSRSATMSIRNIIKLKKKGVYLDPDYPVKQVTRLLRARKKAKHGSKKWGKKHPKYNNREFEMEEFMKFAPQTPIKDWRKLTLEKKGHLSHKLNPGGLFADEKKQDQSHIGPLVANYTFKYS